MLGEYGEELEADLFSHYGIDIHALASPDLTWRRLRVLIAGLPPTARLNVAANGASAEDREWSLSNHLAASALEMQGWTNYLLGALLTQNSQKLKRNPIPEPKPIPRPGVNVDKGKTGKGMMSLVRALGAPV